ncbi:MAG: tRNA (adenosine(37)-N6)-threonylcarbamoyltransferase complex ATPase subunit type 1 TsaE [Crocinitomicaceae bacterium]
MQKGIEKRWEHLTLESLSGVAKELIDLIPRPVFVAIQGEMGAGKTTFVQNVLRGLGIEKPDGSPTYAIIHEYLNPEGVKVYHLDCYRIENEQDILQLGLDELFEENAYFFVEWPDKIEKILPEDANWLYIRCEPLGELREIVLNYDN